MRPLQVAKLLLVLLLGSVSVWAQSTIEPIQLPPIKNVTLDNGLKVIVIEQPSLPIVQLNLLVRVGNIHDPSDKAGLAQFTASMLRQGTSTRTAEQISEEIDFVGGSLGASADVERTSVTARVLKKDLQVGLNLLADIVQNPNFPEKEMGILRNQFLASVRGMRDDPSELAEAHFNFALFGSIHPLGRPMTEESIKAITRDDLVNFHAMYYRPNNAILTVAGDVKSDEIVKLIRDALAGWTRKEVPPTLMPATTKPKGYTVRFVHKPGQTQMHIEMGHFGVSVNDSDYIPTVLANYVLGGGAFSSRLLQVVRSQAGKTYSIFSFFPSYSKDVGGYFRISTFTRNEQAFETLQLILDEFKKFKEGGITAEELQAAQDNIAGSYILRLETLSGLATTISNVEFYGFTLDRVRNYRKLVRSVTLEQANQAIRDRFDPENLAIVLLSDAKILEGRSELISGLSMENVGVVDWLAPITAKAKSYTEFLAAAAAPKGPTKLEWKAQITPDAKALLEKALAAQGGFERVAQIRDTYTKSRGSVFQGGRESKRDDELWIKLPNKLRLQMKFPGGEALLVYDGVQVWLQFGGQVRDYTAQALEDVREAIELDPLLMLWNIAREGYQFELGGKDQVEGQEVQIVRVTNERGKSADLYFDLKKFVPLKIVTQTAEGKKRERLLSDYRQVEGFWVPFAQKDLEDQELVGNFEILEFRINTGVGDEQFEKP
ncbi:MAG: insulinase family protein [Candidatus Bipolaricaulota bacterium]|nr:insulinase family protein [Candidatus Bipolaricaulota bacterium]